MNGFTADDNQFPWQASIRAREISNGPISHCGGSLIHPSWVLTAAHCTVSFNFFSVSLGSTLLNLPRVLIDVTAVFNHPYYNEATLNNDISIMLLAEAVELSDSIQTIRLPMHSQQTFSFEGYQALVSGFGYTSTDGSISNQLMWINARVILNSECANVFGSSVIIESTICAHGWDDNFQSTCNGDSGGPMVIYEDGAYTQIGVVSFVSEDGCHVGHPHGYIRTSYFIDWISSISGIEIR